MIGDVNGPPPSSRDNANELMLSPRYRNRLTFQAIEAGSIVKNLATNRQSTYGINWALKQYEDPQQQATMMLSPRASNHIAELEKLIDTTVSRKKVEKIVADKNLAIAPDMKECQGVCGLDLDRWTEQWPDEWRHGNGHGPVPDAIRSLPDSIQLIDDIERWLLQQEQEETVTITAEPVVESGGLQHVTSVISANVTAPDSSIERQVQGKVTKVETSNVKRPLRDVVPGYRHRLLTSPLLYTPAGFGPYAVQTITLPKPRAQSTKSVASKPPRSDPIVSDYVVVNNHHVKRRRVRKMKRRSSEADDVVTELSSISDQWTTPPMSRSMTSRRASLFANRKSSIATLIESQRGSERKPKARIAHGRLEFVIPESTDESVNGPVQMRSESVSKLTALQRYRLKMQHRKKLREDSENFVDELEKQLDKSEIRARFLNPVHEPKFRQHFMQHSQSTIMKSLSGEAQRFLYSESKNKTRHVQIEQRQPRREIHNALQRIDQVHARRQHHRDMLEQQYLLSLRQFNVTEALAATHERLQRYRRETERLQTELHTNKILKS